ncbi:transposase [Streptomyces sp. NPDC054783]
MSNTYSRGGAVACLPGRLRRPRRTGVRPHRAQTGVDPFMNLVAQVMTQEPYASAKRVCWIVDNRSSHRGQKAADRLSAAFPNAAMVHTPMHASWLNQVEIYFSVVQRKVVSPTSPTSPRSGTGSEPSKTATTPRHSRSSGSSPPPT